MKTVLLDKKIEDLDFLVSPWGPRMATRVRNGLLRAGITTVAQLTGYTKEELQEVDEGLGTVSVVLIEKKLESMGLTLQASQQ